jgi:hypothetical protein
MAQTENDKSPGFEYYLAIINGWDVRPDEAAKETAKEPGFEYYLERLRYLLDTKDRQNEA